MRTTPARPKDFHVQPLPDDTEARGTFTLHIVSPINVAEYIQRGEAGDPVARLVMTVIGRFMYQIDTGDGRFGCILCDKVRFLPGCEPPWGYLVMVPTALDAPGVALPAPACAACLHSADLHETIMARVRQHFPEIKLATGGIVQ